MDRNPTVPRRFRFLAALMLAALLAVGVAACGGGSSSTESSATSESTGSEAAAGTEEASSEEASSEESKEPITIGLALAKTGPLAPYDLQPGEALQLRLKQLNEEGGVDGREVKTKWIDTKSEKTLGSSAATELINQGASVIVATADFDYGSPAVLAAKEANVPGIFLAASAPQSANPAIVGEFGFTMGAGSDSEAVAAAEWVVDKQGWKKGYLLKDTSLEYTKANFAYFKKRFEELGGSVTGEDEFVGGENADISTQATRAKSATAGAEFIFVSSWNPAAATAARQLREAGVDLPIVTNQASDGTLTKEVAGEVKNYYSLPLACIPTYCSGKGSDQNAVDQFSEAFEAEYGESLASSYPISGYNLANALAQAIETAGSSEPEAIGEAMQSMGPVTGLLSKFEFTAECHRPVGESRVVLEWTDGKAEWKATVAPKFIPELGDGNVCAGDQKSF